MDIAPALREHRTQRIRQSFHYHKRNHEVPAWAKCYEVPGSCLAPCSVLSILALGHHEVAERRPL